MGIIKTITDATILLLITLLVLLTDLDTFTLFLSLGLILLIVSYKFANLETTLFVATVLIMTPVEALYILPAYDSSGTIIQITDFAVHIE